jgi:hypothetical protein
MTEAQLGSHQAALHREVCALQAQLSSEGKARQAAHQAALDELSLGVNDRLVQASGLEVLKEEVRPSLPCTVSRCVSLTGSPAANPTPPPHTPSRTVSPTASLPASITASSLTVFFSHSSVASASPR